MTEGGRCPYGFDGPAPRSAKANKEWWPNRLDLSSFSHPLADRSRRNHPAPTFDYAAEVRTLDHEALVSDLRFLLTDSQEWWPADYGHYGPFLVRMAWHSAGTYRAADGRGGSGSGTLRFAPLNSWPDNANLDKARRLLWPIKKKWGRKISWADLMILSANVAMEDMGFETFGFGFGRADVYAPDDGIYWGPEGKWLDDDRHAAQQPTGEGLEKPLGAVQMGLIYVNPEGPGGNCNPLDAANDIRTTFGRMAMNDEETVALIAGGHTFGKAHGAAPADKHVGPEPEGASTQEQGFGWSSTYKSGKGSHTITSGLEGAWTARPISWDSGYFDNLFGYEWKQAKSPGGATQWIPTDLSAQNTVPDAHDRHKKHAPVMFTTDLALRYDPIYGPISKRFHEHPEELRLVFAKAWYKLTHKDLGPISRLEGPYVPVAQKWQDPIPPSTHALVDERDLEDLKRRILLSGLSISQLVQTAWASASTYRSTDHRGGGNGARIRLAPQKDWDVNCRAELSVVLSRLQKVRSDFNADLERSGGGKAVSFADVIVLGGCVAVEQGAEKAGTPLSVPFLPGRTDASQEETDVESFGYLEPRADGFRNYFRSADCGGKGEEEMLVEKASMLNLSAPEMTVLLGGMRVLGANSFQSQLGVFTKRPESLSNDFFANLLDMGVAWKPVRNGREFEGRCRRTGSVSWRGSKVDLVFGSNSELRAIAEYYACDDSKDQFVNDFVAAWTKVMNLDRFDLNADVPPSNPRSRL